MSDRNQSTARPTFFSADPRTGRSWGSPFTEASSADVQEAGERAGQVSVEFGGETDDRRAAALRGIAANLRAASGELLPLADRETGLGAHPRLENELKRTVSQVEQFAAVAEDGRYFEPVIDTASGNAGVDIRRVHVPIGPVAIFGASNFPFAFGTLGGDVASALAVGCPVVVKGHPSHPATSELLARLARQALESVGMPADVLQLLQGRAHEVGEELVLHPEIQAVGFTGSLSGGRALYDLAATREVPIPVFAEMGSLNPVFVLPDAARRDPEQIAAGFAESALASAGQYCTKPGLLVLPPGRGGADIEGALRDAYRMKRPEPLLNSKVLAEYGRSRRAVGEVRGVSLLAGAAADGEMAPAPSLYRCDERALLASDVLQSEHFGPLSIVVTCQPDVMPRVASMLPSSLAASVFSGPRDKPAARALVDVLTRRVGRIVSNGFPTGVAVVHAMQHGGPYPSTTAASHTSVGSGAAKRFLRPVAFQNVPEELLPARLRDDDRSTLFRIVDGSVRIGHALPSDERGASRSV